MNGSEGCFMKKVIQVLVTNFISQPLDSFK
jgi:hypothetical protein